MSLYSVEARGPSSEKYAEILVDECTAYWKAGGRQESVDFILFLRLSTSLFFSLFRCARS
jgi:hypothetical protein